MYNSRGCGVLALEFGEKKFEVSQRSPVVRGVLPRSIPDKESALGVLKRDCPLSGKDSTASIFPRKVQMEFVAVFLRLSCLWSEPSLSYNAKFVGDKKKSLRGGGTSFFIAKSPGIKLSFEVAAFQIDMALDNTGCWPANETLQTRQQHSDLKCCTVVFWRNAVDTHQG